MHLLSIRHSAKCWEYENEFTWSSPSVVLAVKTDKLINKAPQCRVVNAKVDVHRM